MADDFFALTDAADKVLKDLWAVWADAKPISHKVVGYKKVKELKGGGWDPKLYKIWLPVLSARNRQHGPTISNLEKDAGHSTHQRFYFTSKMYDASFGITLSTVEMVNGPNAAAAVNELSVEMKVSREGVMDDLARDYHGDSSGFAAYIASAQDNATIDCVPPVHLEVGDIVQMMDASDDTSTLITNDDAVTAIGDKSWVSNLPQQTVTITDSPSGSATDDYLIRSMQADGTAADTAKTFLALGTWGLGAIIDDANPGPGNYGGVSRAAAAYAFMKAIVARGDSSSAYPYINTTYFRALSRDIMQSLWDEQILAGGKLDYILCSQASVDEYLGMMEMDTKRTPAIVKTVDAALEGPGFHEKPLVADPYCLPCRMYFMDDSAIGKKTIWPVKPFPDANRALRPDPSGGGAYSYKYSQTTRLQVVSPTPWKLGVLVDLKENHHARI